MIAVPLVKIISRSLGYYVNVRICHSCWNDADRDPSGAQGLLAGKFWQGFGQPSWRWREACAILPVRALTFL